MRRICTSCRTQLAGKRGHGFPTRDGHGIQCGGCAFPKKAPTLARVHTPPRYE